MSRFFHEAEGPVQEHSPKLGEEEQRLSRALHALTLNTKPWCFYVADLCTLHNEGYGATLVEDFFRRRP